MRTYPIFALLVTLGIGCGGSGETNNASGTTTGTGGSGTGGATASSSITGTGTGGAGTGGQGTGGTGGQGTGGAPAGTVVPVLESSDLFVNCQPIVGPDPVNGSFLVKYTNNGAFPASATITTAKLTFGTGPNSLPWAFPVTPPSGGPVQPGATLPVNHTKQPQSGAPEGQPCGFCNDSWTLTVTWDIGGNTVTSSLPAAPVQCVF